MEKLASKRLRGMARGLGVDFDEGVTQAGLNELVRNAKEARRIERALNTANPKAIGSNPVAVVLGAGGLTHRTHRALGEKAKRLREMCRVGDVVECPISYVDPVAQACVVFRMDARDVRLVVVSTGRRVKMSADRFMSHAKRIVSPTEGYVHPMAYGAIVCKGDRERERVERVINTAVSRVSASDTYRSGDVVFCKISALERAIEGSSAKAPPVAKERPKLVPGFCVRCGVGGVLLRIWNFSRHRCKTCLGQSVAGSTKRFCIVCGKEFADNHSANVTCGDTCRSVVDERRSTIRVRRS